MAPGEARARGGATRNNDDDVCAWCHARTPGDPCRVCGHGSATPLANPRRARANPTDDEIRTLVARVTGQAKIERNVTGDFRKLRRRRSLLRAAAEQREIDARLAAMLAPSPAPAPAPAPAPFVVEAEPVFLPEAD